MDKPIIVRLLTLNCWGIVLISKDRRARLQAISKHLAHSNLDFVCLQEVWSVNDYKFISKKAKQALPYSHYWNSGVNGPGLCVLSKYPIIDVYFHQWPINGYAHKILQADWFGGKGVGLCRIQMNDTIVNLYTTHLHAEYDTKSLEYLNHRIVQSFETSQFIKFTSRGCDLAVLAGDLNSEPEDPAIPLLLLNAQLQDSFTVAQKRVIDCEGTNESVRNSYAPAKEIKLQPQGKRIDYIMLKGSPNLQVDVTEYSYPMPDRVPGCSFSYSDHEAVQIVMQCRHQTPAQGANTVDPAYSRSLAQALSAATTIADEAVTRLQSTRVVYYTSAAMLAALLVLFTFIEIIFPFDDPTGIVFFNILKYLLTGLLLFTGLMGSLWVSIELSALLNCKYAMRLLLRQLNGAENSNGHHS